VQTKAETQIRAPCTRMQTRIINMYACTSKSHTRSYTCMPTLSLSLTHTHTRAHTRKLTHFYTHITPRVQMHCATARIRATKRATEIDSISGSWIREIARFGVTSSDSPHLSRFSKRVQDGHIGLRANTQQD